MKSRSSRQQKLHPVFEELAKDYGLYWSRRSRPLQTALVRFRSGHLRGMTFVQGVKSLFNQSLLSPCFSCSSSRLLGHFSGTVVWRPRPDM
ncbi:hypothetical protein TNCV_2853291 [Trichonephila clavipes]|uniref:Uncharacterized protein n=1 Tax=Trichonephila clavipes TaxID=2585209 RepID=A0A8X6RAE5_TRICX|nr:hypothetical protein TNCV_2853291 [Trichonephila clavipes]